jgi:hypothetical protein
MQPDSVIYNKPYDKCITWSLPEQAGNLKFEIWNY